jgi:hypothetical protein
MNGAPDNPKWILKCRDLVELYYGARMVTSIRETVIIVQQSVVAQVMQPDPRRIRYEVIIGSEDVASQFFQLSTSQDKIVSQGNGYDVPPGDTIVVDRDFLTDFDAVTLPLFFLGGSNNLDVSVRETFLTPLPADES